MHKILNVKFMKLNMNRYIDKITERLGAGKGEAIQEAYGNAQIGIVRPRVFQADHLSFGLEVGNVVIVHKGQGRGNGQGKDLTGLEGYVVIEVKKSAG